MSAWARSFSANIIASLVYGRYIAASVAALAADYGAFLGLLTADAAPEVAAALGYSAGIVLHWWLSTRVVFVDAAVESPGQRGRQKMLFVLSGLIGLMFTTSIVGLGASLGCDPRLAKIVAIGVSFQLVWLLRRHWVFRAR